jgi:hypothetical protein
VQQVYICDLAHLTTSAPCGPKRPP